MEERDLNAALARMGSAERAVMKELTRAGHGSEALRFAEIFAYFPAPGVRLATEEEIERLNVEYDEVPGASEGNGERPPVVPSETPPPSSAFRIPEGPRGGGGVARESVDVKGRRLLTEGRLQITRVDSDGVLAGLIVAKCRGDSAEIYDLGYDPRPGTRNGWRCTCEARGNCAHLVALKLVTVKPSTG